MKYLKGVVYEFGVEVEFRRDLSVPVVQPVRTWGTSRDGERHPFVPGYPEPAEAAAAEPAPETAPEAPAEEPDTLKAIARDTGRRLGRRLPEPVKAPLRKVFR